MSLAWRSEKLAPTSGPVVEYNSPGNRTKYTRNAANRNNSAINPARCHWADGSTVTRRWAATTSWRNTYNTMVASRATVVSTVRKAMALATTGTVKT